MLATKVNGPFGCVHKPAMPFPRTSACLWLAILPPPLKLCGFVLIGCGIFFVRGSFSGWIGYSIAYTVTILGSTPLWALSVVPRRDSEALGVAKVLRAPQNA